MDNDDGEEPSWLRNNDAFVGDQDLELSAFRFNITPSPPERTFDIDTEIPDSQPPSPCQASVASADSVNANHSEPPSVRDVDEPMSTGDPEEDTDEEGLLEVEGLVSHQVNHETKCVLFDVEWEGLPEITQQH
ncbi:hypothetical protein G7046_g1208 [Stylonectria norvegica]|nr:hypothetical protein G7046_g1208 [Stylonectria norvegica]